MLSIERLRILHAVATYGSVNAAPSALHVTNSAVSQQIAKLESELGQPLLERNGRGVRLTDATAVQPWGTRSFYFRDPDGNLIDLYAPVKTP
jgi:catechol 2,3-dioxygenase-like lactoylglutathione lyase family enzyme